MNDASTLPPIWAVPEVIEKVAKVKSFINHLLRTKNYFGWKFFIDDLKSEIECEIYKYEDLHRQGKYKETGVGAYCNMAVQGAINYAAKMSTYKRRINFETISLDGCVETEKGAVTIQVPAPESDEVDKLDLLLSIEQEFGEKIRELAQAVLEGRQISRAELTQLRKSTKNSTMRRLLTEV